MLKVLAVSALCVAGVAAQDPATGWMAYAQGSIPSGAERITKLEVRGDDRAGGAPLIGCRLTLAHHALLTPLPCR